MTSLRITSALALAGILAVGRGTDAGRAIEHSDRTNLARIVFYGPQGGQTDLLGQPAIFVNGVSYARLVRGSYFYINIPPGLVAVCIWQPNHGCRTIQAFSGNIYYFKATYPFPHGYNLDRVDTVSGEVERLNKANSPIPLHLIKDKAVEIDLK